MKTIVKLLAILIAIVVCAAGAAIYYLDSIAKTAIERGAEYALGVPTDVDKVRIGLASGSFKVGGLAVANPSGFERPHFLRLGSARLELPPRRLLEDTVRVALVELDGVEVDIERGSKGSNYGAILDHVGRLESGSTAPASSSDQETGGKRFVIDQLIIRNVSAHVALALAGVAKPGATVTVPEIALHDVGAEEGGVSMGEIAAIVTKAVLSSVSRAGALPVDIARDLAGNLKGLANVAIELPPGVGDAAKGLIGAGKGLTGGAAAGAGKGAEEVQKALKGLGGLLGGKK
ncbi:MAG: hypothetical protein D6760_07300 [Deltaproteobacteria bacterium]|nr:MAG: hypothetical protein D6760_07300 [Deltaproteobacteria bacterium]